MKEILNSFQEYFINCKPNERMRTLRRQRNLTIKQIAEKCIITEKMWSNWENGKAIPRKDSRKRIAFVLGVKEEMIFGKPKCVYLDE